MEKETKRKIKKIKKQLKAFQKLAKYDAIQSLELIPAIKGLIKELLAMDDLKDDEKLKKKFKGIEAGFDIYISNIKTLEDFKKKWD